MVPPEEVAAIHKRLHGDPDDDFIDEGAGDEWETEAAAAAIQALESGRIVMSAAGALLFLLAAGLLLRRST